MDIANYLRLVVRLRGGAGEVVLRHAIASRVRPDSVHALGVVGSSSGLVRPSAAWRTASLRSLSLIVGIEGRARVGGLGVSALRVLRRRATRPPCRPPPPRQIFREAMSPHPLYTEV